MVDSCSRGECWFWGDPKRDANLEKYPHGEEGVDPAKAPDEDSSGYDTTLSNRRYDSGSLESNPL